MRWTAQLRAARVPVIGTHRDGKLWLDVRTIGEDELADVAEAVRALAIRFSGSVTTSAPCPPP